MMRWTSYPLNSPFLAVLCLLIVLNSDIQTLLSSPHVSDTCSCSGDELPLVHRNCRSKSNVRQTCFLNLDLEGLSFLV
ncbi:hypothetical protein BDV11DRAFT_198709 [Aspergillus similis]